MTQIPTALILSRAIEEIVNHSSVCDLVVPSLNGRNIFQMQRSIPGEYRAKSWEWFALSTREQRHVRVPYLFAISPAATYVSPLHNVPSCARCGSAAAYTTECGTLDGKHPSSSVSVPMVSRSTNYLFEKSFQCKEFFQLSGKYLAPVFMTLISSFVVVLFRVSLSVDLSGTGRAMAVAPTDIVFAADWWSRCTRPDLASSVFSQYVGLHEAAAKEGFISADATPFNMLLLFGVDDSKPLLVWPACLSWYFHSDRHVVQPSALNTLDSCTFTTFAFRAKAAPKKDTAKRKQHRGKPFERSMNLARHVLADDYRDVSLRAKRFSLADESVSTIMFLERCSEPNSFMTLLTVKSIAIDYLTHVGVSFGAFRFGSFDEIARRPSAVALSEKGRHRCIDNLECQLRHTFRSVTAASNGHEHLHRFVCDHLADAIRNVQNAENVSAIFAFVRDAVLNNATNAMRSNTKESFSGRDRTILPPL